MDITALEIVFITVIRVNGREAVRLEDLETFYCILKVLIQSTIQEATAQRMFFTSGNMLLLRHAFIKNQLERMKDEW